MRLTKIEEEQIKEELNQCFYNCIYKSLLAIGVVCLIIIFILSYVK